MGEEPFIDSGTKKFAVTNYHVLEEFRLKRQEKGSIVFQLGSYMFNNIEDLLIAEDQKKDLITFSVPQEFLEGSSKQFCPCFSWPPKRVDENETILFAGYPGNFREEISPSAVRSESALRLELVKSSSPNYFTIFLDNINSIKYFGYRDISELKKLGGFSGVAVFRIRQDNLIETIEPTGIIFEGNDSLNTLLARHIDFINADGTISSG